MLNAFQNRQAAGDEAIHPSEQANEPRRPSAGRAETSRDPTSTPVSAVGLPGLKKDQTALPVQLMTPASTETGSNRRSRQEHSSNDFPALKGGRRLPHSSVHTSGGLCRPPLAPKDDF